MRKRYIEIMQTPPPGVSADLYDEETIVRAANIGVGIEESLFLKFNK